MLASLVLATLTQSSPATTEVQLTVKLVDRDGHDVTGIATPRDRPITTNVSVWSGDGADMRELPAELGKPLKLEGPTPDEWRVGLSRPIEDPQWSPIHAPVLAPGWAWVDESKVFVLNGTVASIYLGNPHAQMMVKTAEGTWVVDLAPLPQTQGAGFVKGVAKVGDTVTLVGHRSRSPDLAMKAKQIRLSGL